MKAQRAIRRGRPASQEVSRPVRAESNSTEWQTDALASASTSNAQLQGDDVSSFDAETATTRLGNVTQISRKTLVIADTLDVVKKAGRKSEVAYQVAKKLKELKREDRALAA